MIFQSFLLHNDHLNYAGDNIRALGVNAMSADAQAQSRQCISRHGIDYVG